MTPKELLQRLNELTSFTPYLAPEGEKALWKSDVEQMLTQYSERTCEWNMVWDESINDYKYDTQCKKSFGDKDNLTQHCPFCGGKIKEKG